MSLITDIYSSYSQSINNTAPAGRSARTEKTAGKDAASFSDDIRKMQGSSVPRPEITETATSSDIGNSGKVRVSGKTIGNVSLSKTANDYYESLKKKFSNLDFVVVSKDQKKAAQANAASYGNPHKTVVLIDEEKLEKMATDEKFRKQYEGIIENSSKKLQAFGQQLQAGGLSGLVKGFGMNVTASPNGNDGGTSSFFAAVDKNLALQKKRIEKKAAEKKAEKKADEKDAAEKLKEKHAEKKEEAKEQLEELREDNEEEFDWNNALYISSYDPDALYRAISDYGMKAAEGKVFAKEELTHGQKIDFSA